LQVAVCNKKTRTQVALKPKHKVPDAANKATQLLKKSWAPFISSHHRMTIDRSHHLREGSIPRLLAAFSIPAIVGLLAQALYNIVDRVFIGQALESEGIAGISVCFPFMLVIMAFAMLIGLGAAALISIRLGEQKKDEAELVLGNAVVLILWASAAVTIAGLLLLDRLLTLFGASAAILPFARDYMQIIALGTICQMISFGLNAPIRGEGNPPVAMLTMIIGVVLNAILAPIFIFGFGWGMRGAAFATVISQGVSAFWVMAYFLRGRSLLRLRWENMRLKKSVCVAMLAIGASPFALQTAAAVMQSILNNQLDKYGGDEAIAAMGIIYAVSMMFFMPMFGINQGAQPIMGFNYGAGLFDRVQKTLKTSVLAATTIALAGFLTMVLAPAQVVRLFGSEDKTLLALGVHAMRVCVVSMPLVGFQVVGTGYFIAVGKPREAMLVSLSRQVLFLIPYVLIFPSFFGLNGVWAAIPSADLSSALLTGALLAVELRYLRKKQI
jgi:putative MATE family efflux protein